MKIFVTGATGYIGAAVVEALVKAGHEVTGLVRTREREAVVRAQGATPLPGNLAEPRTYLNAAAAHDACIHLGFDAGSEAVATDRTAIETFREVLTRRGNDPSVLVYTSGVLVLGDTGDTPADESASTAHAVPMVAWRPAHEQLALAAATASRATTVVRPGFVYGGGQGLIAGYFESAVREGAAVHVGDGANRIALVHRDDLADLYRRIVEARARGIFHGVDGASPRILELATAASEAAGRRGATRRLGLAQARTTMGPFADALCVDRVVVTRRSADIGWTPHHRPFVQSAHQAFDEWRAARPSGE